MGVGMRVCEKPSDNLPIQENIINTELFIDRLAAL